MATDVELSPNQTGMDCLTTAPSPCNTVRKSKGIRDFFTTCSSTSTVHNKKIETYKAQASQMQSESCANKSEQGRAKESESVADNGVSEYKHKNKTRVTENEAKQNVSVLNSNSAPTSETTRLSTGEKKKSLSTSKKAKEEKSVDSNVVERDQIEQEDVPTQDETKDMPQEMDYGEFLKTFVQNQDDDFSAVCSTVNKDKGQPTLQSSPVGTDVQKRNAPKQPCKKNKTRDSGSTHLEKSKELCESKTKSANAFSILMQAKPVTIKEKPVDDGCVEKTDIYGRKSTSCAHEDDEDDTSDVSEVLPVETTPTPSLLNFFTKKTKSTTKDDDCRGSVLVEVDVHYDPTKQKTTPTRKKPNNLQLQKVEKHAKTSAEDDNEITFLGSETIDIEDDNTNIRPRSKSKKMSLSQNVPQIEPPTKTPDGTKAKGSTAEEAIHLEKKNAFLQDATTPDQTVKTAQATLHFSQGGKLATNTTVIAKSTSKTASCDSENIEGTETQKKRTKKKYSTKEASSEVCEEKTTRIKRRERAMAKNESSESTNGRSEKDQPGRTALLGKSQNTERQGRTTRLRKAVESGQVESNSNEGSGSDSKDFSPRSSKKSKTGSASKSRAQELLMKAKQQKQDSHQKRPRSKKSQSVKSVCIAKKKKEEESDAESEVLLIGCDPGPRRQSRRLAEQQKVKQAAEDVSCISVDSDSGAEDAPSPQKKSTRKETSRASNKNSSSGSSPKKPVGKLAPIFAKKAKEAVDSSLKEPQEDPEVVRRRREFLSSGVPSELKKQAACATACVVTSEFAPFPENSHVQQKLPVETGSMDVWSLGSPVKMRGLYKEGEDRAEIKGADLKWSSLLWRPLAHDERLRADFKLLAPVSYSLGQAVKQQLIADLQQTQPGFPFSALCDKFQDRLGPAAVKQEEAPGTISTVKARKKRMAADIIIIDESDDIATAQNDRDTQWPERLQPTCASEMIGNESCIRRLRYWLEEWKTLIQREARLSARRTAAAAASRDSDFAYSGEDSDEEGSELCNTMMLVGPHGVGKTAAVYALAQQLAYKVFEVNASSSRQGRHIVAQLQEATQSHQVAQKRDGIVLSPPPLTPTLGSQPEPPVEKTGKRNTGAVPKAFASFFKKSDNVAEAKTTPRTASPKADKKRKPTDSPKRSAKKGGKGCVESEGSRRRRRGGADDVEIVEEIPASKKRRGENRGKQLGKPEDRDESNLAGCLNLTSTSLILFDEVDLVFGEDSGFLQTVQHFIHTTKIPIILTTTDPGFQRCLTARLETLVFKRPPIESMVSYLRTVCVAAGLRTSADDVRRLAWLCGGDLRRALLHLQFTALSGGGVLKLPRPIHLAPPPHHALAKHKTHSKQALTSSTPPANPDSDDDDFVCLKPVRKKRRRILDDEDGGSISVSALDGAHRETGGKVQEQDSGVVISAEKLPTVHLHLYESVLGISSQLHNLLVEAIQGEYSYRSMHELVEQCLTLNVSDVDMLHASVLRLLPLPHSPPTTLRPHRGLPPSLQPAAAVKRKRIRSDIYDSEGSDSESSPKEQPASVKTEEQVKNDREEPGASERVLGESDSLKSDVESSNELLADDGNKKNEKECGESVTAVESMEVDNCSANGEDNKDISQSTEMPTEQNQKSEVGADASQEVSHEDNQSSEISLKGSKKSMDHGLGSKLLSSFARCYESLSAVNMSVDSSHPSCFPCVKGRRFTQPGIECVPSREERNWSQWGEEMATEIEVHSNRKLWQQVSSCVTAWKESCGDSLPEGCSIPVPTSSSTVAFSNARLDSSVPEPYSKVMTEVADSLPSAVSSSALVLDYLPTLRCISQAEHCRQIAKTKRRFHHHFDSIGLCLSQTTVTALSADFLAGQPHS